MNYCIAILLQVQDGVVKHAEAIQRSEVLQQFHANLLDMLLTNRRTAVVEHRVCVHAASVSVVVLRTLCLFSKA
jgi:hypothetical protein